MAESADVFVYGTLTDRSRAAAVLGEFEFAGAATLEGLHRVDGAYPTLAPGGSVDGRVLRTPEIATLDAYEGVDRGLYVRASVERADGGAVEVYVGDPERLDAPADWPGEGPFARRVREYVRDRATVRPRE